MLNELPGARTSHSRLLGAKAKLDQLKDERRISKLPRQPLLAEPGTVQLPRFVYWLVGDEARDGAWSLMDLGLLAGILGAFAKTRPAAVPRRPF